MCGIVGIVRRTQSPPLAVALPAEERSALLNSIRHRGPDCTGQFADETVWLGHARLSIIDLSQAASQPMAAMDGRFVISYNGEVYNFRELAAELGVEKLCSHSDTEVVLRSFAERGAAAFEQLNGIFAFALYDRVAGKLWLVRDRLGVKPLYYRFDARGLAFASEVAALQVGGPLACDVSSLHEWLYFGTSLGARTVYQGVERLLPGHYLELDLAEFSARTVEYWSPSRYAGGPKFAGSRQQAIEDTRALLEQAVRRQLVSDVPVGVFLSGGVDSSAITAFASRHYGGRLATFSVGFDFDRGVNELPTARRIAAQFGTEHHEIHVAGPDIADVVVKMIDHHGVPFSDAANIPLFLLCNELGGQTKVVLQGDGGDELFGGYSRYSTLSHLRLARGLAKIASLANRLTPRSPAWYRRQRYFRALGPSDRAEIMARLLTEEDVHSSPELVFDHEFRHRVLASDAFRRYREVQAYFAGEDMVNQMLFVDAMIILPDIFLEKVDRATMAAGVEVRVPFLDNELVEYCFRLPGDYKVRRGRKKWLLKNALRGIVPDDVLFGPKNGFGVPYGHWLRHALRPLFFDQLDTFEASHPGVLNGGMIRKLYEEHRAERRDRSFLLWKLLSLTTWANRTGTTITV